MPSEIARLTKWVQTKCQVEISRTCTGFSSTRFDCVHYNIAENTPFMFWSNEKKTLLCHCCYCCCWYSDVIDDMRMGVFLLIWSITSWEGKQRERKRMCEKKPATSRKKEKQTHYARQNRDIDDCYCCTFSFVIFFFSFLFFVAYLPVHFFFSLSLSHACLVLCYAVNGHAGNPWCALGKKRMNKVCLPENGEEKAEDRKRRKKEPNRKN